MSQPDKKIRVGISVGDITGIGIEVILKTFEDPRMLEFCTPIVFGSVKTLSFQRKHLGLTTDFRGIDAISHAIDGKMNVLSIWKEHPDMEFGKPTQTSGTLAIQSLKAATEALKNDVVDVLVTAPISKHNIQSEDFSFPGHTGYLASVFKGESVMFMIADSLRIALLTDHIAIKEVADAITPELIERKLQYVHHSLIQDFQVIRPKIAFLGINPHSGDEGVIGQEDEKVMKPAIKKMFDSGKLVFGPYPADSFFGSENYKKFDAVVAAYHDQGLIPFKTLAFGRGVNYTAGLRKIRTSPDHGTAYEIAGKGEANVASFQEAVFLALEIFKNRERYKANKANPLSFSRERESDKKSD
jgi:4-hydroxythreonine-4-phosphate dehydrogenase